MDQRWFPGAAPDSRVIVITVGVVAGLLLSVGLSLQGVLTGGGLDDSYALIAVLIAVVLLYRGAIAVRGYRLVPGDPAPILWIERWLPVGRRGVPLKRLHAVRVEPNLPRILNTGILSMGGIFGWAGTAVVRDLGYVDAYGMNNGKAVVLEFEAAPGKESLLANKAGPIYVVTPADPQAFADAVRAAHAGLHPVAPGAFHLAELGPASSPPAAPAPGKPAAASRPRKRRK